MKWYWRALAQSKTIREIAQKLKRAPPTISREIKRHKSVNTGRYSPDKAQNDYKLVSTLTTTTNVWRLRTAGDRRYRLLYAFLYFRQKKWPYRSRIPLRQGQLVFITETWKLRDRLIPWYHKAHFNYFKHLACC